MNSNYQCKTPQFASLDSLIFSEDQSVYSQHLQRQVILLFSMFKLFPSEFKMQNKPLYWVSHFLSTALTAPMLEAALKVWSQLNQDPENVDV